MFRFTVIIDAVLKSSGNYISSHNNNTQQPMASRAALENAINLQYMGAPVPIAVQTIPVSDPSINISAQSKAPPNIPRAPNQPGVISGIVEDLSDRGPLFYFAGAIVVAWLFLNWRHRA